MRRCAEHKAKTGRDLIDIFVFHGYPMTPQLGWENQAAFAHPTPALQELRVRDVRLSSGVVIGPDQVLTQAFRPL